MVERLRTSRLARRESWKSTPRSMRVCLYAAVFSLFASMGVLALLMLPEIILIIVITGGFAVGYASVSIWQRYWLIPVLGIVQGFLFGLVGALYHGHRELLPPDSPLHRQLVLLAVTGIVSVLLGYVLFVVFFARQGALYFRARNEIAMAAKIHRALVPPIHKTLAPFEVYGISVPSEVGGDLVDITEDGQSWTAYVADVKRRGFNECIGDCSPIAVLLQPFQTVFVPYSGDRC